MPRFIGRSREQTVNWGRTGKFAPASEFGAVWRTAYRRKLITDNNICFNESLVANEDSMFQVWCSIYAASASSISTPLYCYYARATGSLIQTIKGGEKLIHNKIGLLCERMRLINHINTMVNEDVSELVYGSVVFSVLELMVKTKYRNFSALKKYIRQPFVKEVVRDMNYIGKTVFDVPLFLMKIRQYRLLFILIRIATNFGIRIM